MLLKCCTQYVSKFGKPSSGHRTRKGQFSFQSQKKGNAKECPNYYTVVLISYACKVILKIIQARLQQYMNRELPDVQAGFQRGRGTRNQIATFIGSWRKQESLPDHLTCLLRKLSVVQEAIVRTLYGKIYWLNVGKGV